jgi:hypothetical protein
VRDVLTRVRAAVDAGELWSAPCRDVAAWMAENSSSFDRPPLLDHASWTGE